MQMSIHSLVERNNNANGRVFVLVELQARKHDSQDAIIHSLMQYTKCSVLSSRANNAGVIASAKGGTSEEKLAFSQVT